MGCFIGFIYLGLSELKNTAASDADGLATNVLMRGGFIFQPYFLFLMAFGGLKRILLKPSFWVTLQI